MWDKFHIGFWHPFGAYTGQSAVQVLEWKSGEVVRQGWTLWSFVHSPSAAVWLEHLASVEGPVYAFCSHSPNARDPDTNKGTLLASHFRYLLDSSWQAMPDPKVMKVTNPFKRQGLALGFKVSRVVEIEPVVPPFGVEWYSRRERSWRADRVPTRGEFLIRRGGTIPPRRVGAILELAQPYLAELRHESAPNPAVHTDFGPTAPRR
jgi:hypothetical protein